MVLIHLRNVFWWIWKGKRGLDLNPLKIIEAKGCRISSPQHQRLLSSPVTAICQPVELCWVLSWKTTIPESGRKQTGCYETLWILNLFSGVHKKFSLACTGKHSEKLLQRSERPKWKASEMQQRRFLLLTLTSSYPNDVSVLYLNYHWRKS